MLILDYDNLKERSLFEKCVVVLGGFDGLHKGHLALLQRAKDEKLPVILTTFFFEGKRLFSRKERRRIFDKNGVDAVVEIAFEKVKDLSPSAFLDGFIHQNVEKYFAGEDFFFGKDCVGTAETVEKITGRPCVKVKLFKVDGKKVASSEIRRLVKDGKIEKANALLSTPYFLTATVRKGRKVGRTLGFPTANLSCPKQKLLPKNGVYETLVKWQGNCYKAVTNIGNKPTFSVDEINVESYLIGFDGDLYGKEITVFFSRFLRDIKKFDGVDMLKAQIEKDVESVKK